MHTHSLERWSHHHVFLGERHGRNERRTWLVVGLTAAMMIAEIAGGTMFGSMALLADGWHMATHATAIGIAAFAYRYARRHAHDARFSFGTGKVGDLAAFASAVILGLVALMIGYESAVRLYSPVAIHFGEATLIAAIGLVVNLASAWLLFERDGHGHRHDHHHDHAQDHIHGHHHHHAPDLNLRAAYLHVVADALTSVLAIAALLAGSNFGWVWLDPVIGLVGALIIARWALGLIRSSSATLLDTIPDAALATEIRARLEAGTDRISDLHLWRVGPGHHAAIVSLVAHDARPPSFYKAKLAGLPGLSHVTVEVERCSDSP
ncbi:MAG: CDF family Co(II)/Ni(II) efflux transporter DmeF [Pseudorhodoplanes sp.]|nr:CDF family Co(II)/Ni(II) efflux transporter DmeF [Pseudorhodoplanes sp.]